MESFFLDHHKEIRRTVRQFVHNEIMPHVEQWDREETVPFHLVPKAGELGLIGPNFPTEYGGGGQDVVSSCIVAEEIGRAGSGIVSCFIVSEIAVGPIANFGTEQQKQDYLLPTLRGDKIASLGMTETGAGSDVSGVRTVAVRDGDDFVINGGKLFITNGISSDFILLAARTGTVEDRQRGLSLILVDRGTPGFSVKRRLNKLGWRASETAELTFEDCRVPVTSLVGELNRGFYHLMHNLDFERALVGADAVGLADSAFNAAAEYAKQREQFGQPIGKFQAIRHMLVDMHMAVEAARLMVYNSAFAIDSGRPATRESSAAKCYATEVVRKVAADAVQVMGGQGFLMDNSVQRFFRDSPVYTIGGGTSQIQKEIIAKQLGL